MERSGRGRGGGRGCTFLPTANRRAPWPPNNLRALAGGAEPSGCAAARCSGWAGSAESGRSGGAECAGLRERPRPEPGRAAGPWRAVGERLGADCSLSRGASRGASDLSPTGKASVWAPPPLPRPGEPHTGGSIAGGVRERPALASSGREPRPHFPYGGSCLHGTDGIMPSTCTANGARVAAGFAPVFLGKWNSRVLAALGMAKRPAALLLRHCLQRLQIPFYELTNVAKLSHNLH